MTFRRLPFVLFGLIAVASSGTVLAQANCSKPAGQQTVTQQSTTAIQQGTQVQFYSYPAFSTPVFSRRVISSPVIVTQQGFATVGTQQGTVVSANQQAFPFFPLFLGGLSLADALVGGDRDHAVLAAISSELQKLRDNLAAGSAPAGTSEKITAIENFLATEFPGKFKPGASAQTPATGTPSVGNPGSVLIPGAQQSVAVASGLSVEVSKLTGEVSELTKSINALTAEIQKKKANAGEAPAPEAPK